MDTKCEMGIVDVGLQLNYLRISKSCLMASSTNRRDEESRGQHFFNVTFVCRYRPDESWNGDEVVFRKELDFGLMSFALHSIT